jgi:hypothetical protein
VKVNDDAGLEREADQFGISSVNVAFTDKSVPNTDVHTSNILQRKVGFEFETGWSVEAKTRTIRDSDGWLGLGFWREGAYNVMDSNEKRFTKEPQTDKEGYTPLKKKDLVYRGEGFHIEADEAGDGKTELEFVTEPFDDREKLKDVMNNVNNKGNELIKQSNITPNITPFIMSNFRITPVDNDLCAGPQVTFGMALDKIRRYIPSQLDNNVNITNHINGLVSLIKHYIEYGKLAEGKSPLLYPKKIAEPMLARTDFAKLLNLAMIEDNLNKPNFTLDIWLEKFGNVDGQLFGREIYEDYDRPTKSYTPDLLILEWLTGIYNGTDKLAKIKDHEGMGEYGSRTDKVNGKDVGIFENRNEQGTKIPLKDWKSFALTQFDTIEDINQLESST